MVNGAHPRDRRHSPEFLASASALLADDGFAVVGCASTGHDAIAVVHRLRPDIVLLDVQLPDIDGFDVADQLARLSPPPLVVLISSRSSGSYGTAVATAPVRGFLAKLRPATALAVPAGGRHHGGHVCRSAPHPCLVPHWLASVLVVAVLIGAVAGVR